MSLLKITEGSDPNYLATVVELPTVKPHPNADRLEVVEVFGNTIVIGKGSYLEGDKVVYFPIESCLKKEFLSWANLLDKPELNADEKTKGYFESKGRVRAVALRGVPSQGFLFKVSELAKYYKIGEDAFKVGDTFNEVGEDVLLTKYVKGSGKATNEPNLKKSRVPKWLDKTIGFFPRPIRRKSYLLVNAWFNRNQEGIVSRIVEGQFQFHYKTEHLGKNVFLLQPDDVITITSKLHGTSAIFGNILVKKKFSPLRSIGNMMGRKISDKEYQLVYSSRSVVKNRRDEKFTDDVWGIHAKELAGVIPEGITLYGEIVGYTDSGRCIQKGYDYGSDEKTSDFFVYRITKTEEDGTKREFSFDEIADFCSENALTHVPMYYTGEAQDMYDLPLDKDWNNNFLAKLKEDYLDKKCELCKNDVIREGIVVKLDSREKKPVFKFKSPLFLIKESADRDTGEADMEEES